MIGRVSWDITLREIMKRLLITHVGSVTKDSTKVLITKTISIITQAQKNIPAKNVGKAFLMSVILTGTREFTQMKSLMCAKTVENDLTRQAL